MELAELLLYLISVYINWLDLPLYILQQCLELRYFQLLKRQLCLEFVSANRGALSVCLVLSGIEQLFALHHAIRQAVDTLRQCLLVCGKLFS